MPEVDEGSAPLPGELDPSYLVDAGHAVAHFLGRGRVSELAYRPGNGTLYELVFATAATLYSIADWMDHEKRRSIVADRPEWNHDDGAIVLVSWIGHGCFPINLRAVPHDSYLCEKYADCSLGDAHALRQLLLEVSRSAGFASLAVVR